jgi:holo-ACP synthase
MWCAVLRSELLAARDRRQELLARYLAADYPAVVTVALNLPGADKAPPGAEQLFNRLLRALVRLVPGLLNLATTSDSLGPHAIMHLELSPAEAKARCVALEESAPWGRLVDLDVYDRQGTPLSRTSLGLPQRSCLLCDRPAVECIRLRRHPLQLVIGKTHELLATIPP